MGKGSDNSSSNKIINLTSKKYPASTGIFLASVLAFTKFFASLVSRVVSLLKGTSTNQQRHRQPRERLRKC